MNHSTRAPTRYEAERIEAMKKLGCVACAVLGIPYVQIEVHHLLDGGVRMGHWFTIPLCAGHHRGLFTALQRDLLEEKQQVAISDGRKLFRAVYGTERQLWERVQTRLKLPKVWPVSKILPRGRHVEVDTELASDELEVLLGEMVTPTILPRGTAFEQPSQLPGSRSDSPREAGAEPEDVR